MHDIYFAYFSHNDQIINDIWENGVIVLDTNTLLNTYKMETEARNQFFEVLKHTELNPKLWMPYQVGWEFLRNRKITIDGSLKAINNTKILIKREFESIYSTIGNSEIKYHDEFLIKMQNEIDEFKKQILEEVQKYNDENQHKRSDFYNGNHLRDSDPIIEEIKNIYEGKYSDSPKHEDLISKYEEGGDRFSLKIPPGFEDVTKGDYRTYGDYIIWEEMILKSSSENLPVIFVTEDHKKDWWLHDEKTQSKSPLPELLREFKSRTNQYFYMYSYKNFINEAKNRYNDLPETEKATKQMDLATKENELTHVLKKQNKEKYNETFNIVKKIVNEWDPMDLLDLAPDDEYEFEISRIVKELNKVETVETFSVGIERIFSKAFGMSFSKEECLVVAQKIWRETKYNE